VALAAALLSLSIVVAVVALVLAEALLVLAMPRSVLFQERVDHRIEEHARAAAAGVRASLLARMSEPHVRELGELELLTSGTRMRWTTDTTEPPEMGVERVLAVDRLLATYVRLAIAHRRNADAFSCERWVALDEHAARLGKLQEQDSGTGSEALASRWLAHRRSVLVMRQATWERARQDRQAMVHALAVIGEVVRFVHDVSALPIDDRARAEVDHVLESCVFELASVGHLADEVAIDASFFELPPCADPTETETATYVPVGPMPGPDQPRPPRVPEPHAPPVPPRTPTPEPPRPPLVPPPAPDEVPLRLTTLIGPPAVR
jgi:hypothetical protein